MALTNQHVFVPPPMFQTTATNTYATDTLTTAGHYSAMIFHAPKTGSIRSFGISIGTISGSPTADFQLESVSSGLPSGTVLGATNNAKKTGVALTGSTYNDPGDFTEDASVTKGDLLAAVVRYASGTNFQARRIGAGSCFPYVVVNTGTPTRGSTSATIGVKYSDGTYAFIPGTFPSSARNANAYGSGTNPNHRGAVFIPSVAMRVAGLWFLNTAGTLGVFDLILATNAWDGTADNDGTSNAVITMAGTAAAPASGLMLGILPTPFELTAGSTYRVIAKPTTATTITLVDFTAPDTGSMNQYAGLDGFFYYTQANNPSGSGSWTDTTTRFPQVGLYVDQVHASGGGLLLHPGMTGGIKA